MAFANSLLSSSSSPAQIHHGSKDFNSTPLIISPHERSAFTFSPIRNKFSELGIGVIVIVYQNSTSRNAPIALMVIEPKPLLNVSLVYLGPSGMNALKDLGLDVAKGTVLTDGPVKQTKFFITRLDTGRKVEDPDMLERIRLTIINNLLKYHPESSERLAMGEAFGIKAPEKKLDVDITTQVHVEEDGPKRSLLCIETADRPGLLVEIIKIIADVNIDVESAEIDTEGLVAKDKFHVSYRGAALTSSLSQVLVNCLRYYLRRPETDIDSY
ncbi:hypothetical protein D5086_020970 [Populus alba]|uniref:Uncharacterized protein n=1 Tax=Populus alba TaxID=43335 RepID=A0ACC4BMB9_POPAL